MLLSVNFFSTSLSKTGLMLQRFIPSLSYQRDYIQSVVILWNWRRFSWRVYDIFHDVFYDVFCFQETSAKLMDAKRKQLELGHRVLKVIIGQEVTRKRGYTIQVNVRFSCHLNIETYLVQINLFAFLWYPVSFTFLSYQILIFFFQPEEENLRIQLEVNSVLSDLAIK